MVHIGNIGSVLRETTGIESTASLSFFSEAEKLTLFAYDGLREYSVVASEVVSRVAAAILFSPCAALDIAVHSIALLPTTLYSIGKSVWHWEADFTLPWQHMQRIRNAITPLFFGSIFGALHPFAGMAVSEPTDKHIVLGMLTSNTDQDLETPCSPIHSLDIIEELALNHRYAEKDGVKREIFPPEYVQLLRDTRELEEALESLQAQEYIHKITNITLKVMADIKIGVEESSLPDLYKEVLVRLSGVLVPVLTVVDTAVALIAQSFFFATGMLRSFSGRGPIYTEVTANPLMHVAFLIQNALKLAGNLAGTFVWFVSPMAGFEVSLLPANMFFTMQLNHLMQKLKMKMEAASEGERFVLPIVFDEGECSTLSVPSHSMHKTYLIIEKKNDLFHLAWVNRPTVSIKEDVDIDTVLTQIRSMLLERFPFMDIQKLMDYPVVGQKPEFLEGATEENIAPQGGSTNCVVSNLFAVLEVLDRIRREDQATTELRYETVRKVLMNKYGFYKNGFYPFTDMSNGYSMHTIWAASAAHPEGAI